VAGCTTVKDIVKSPSLSRCCTWWHYPSCANYCANTVSTHSCRPLAVWRCSTIVVEEISWLADAVMVGHVDHQMFPFLPCEKLNFLW